MNIFQGLEVEKIFHPQESAVVLYKLRCKHCAKGKTAAGVLNRAKQQHIPVVAIGGCVEMCDSLVQMGFAGIYPILEEKVPLEIAMQRDFAMNNVRKTVARIVPNYLG